MSSPCFYCGARPDIECKHRPADPDWKPPESKAKPDRRGLGVAGGGRYLMPPGVKMSGKGKINLNRREKPRG